jgi:hypothetical protein
VTGTLNWRIRAKFLLRPELRYDYSSQFDYGPTDDPQKWNFSIGMGASYQF